MSRVSLAAQAIVIGISFLLCSICTAQTVQQSETPKPAKATNTAPSFSVKPVIPLSDKNNKTKQIICGVDTIDWGPYMAELQRKIKRAWKPPANMDSSISYPPVLFKVHRDGHVSDVHVYHSYEVPDAHIKPNHESKYPLVEQSYINAVEQAAPFKPLPEGAKDPMDIQFSFNSCPIFSGGKGVFRRF